MPFAVPNQTNTADIFEIFKFVNNDASGGIFFPIILLVIWIIAFSGSIANGRGASRAWIFSSFICVILAILLVIMGFLNKGYLYLLILFIAFGVLWSKLTGRTANV